MNDGLYPTTRRFQTILSNTVQTNVNNICAKSEEFHPDQLVTCVFLKSSNFHIESWKQKQNKCTHLVHSFLFQSRNAVKKEF